MGKIIDEILNNDLGRFDTENFKNELRAIVKALVGLQIENDEKEKRIEEIWNTSVKAEKENMQLHNTIDQLANQIEIQKRNIALVNGGELVAEIMQLRNKNKNLVKVNIQLKEEIAKQDNIKKNRIGNTKIEITLDTSKFEESLEEMYLRMNQEASKRLQEIVKSNVDKICMEMIVPHSHIDYVCTKHNKLNCFPCMYICNFPEDVKLRNEFKRF